MKTRLSIILLILAITCILSLAGCDTKKPQNPAPPVTEESSKPGLAATPSPSEPIAIGFESNAMDISFNYPSDWSVEESGNSVMIASPADQNSAIMIVDISYEVSLFLAGHGDMESSIDALIDKYSDMLSGNATKENYDYFWDQSESGNIQAKASFDCNSTIGRINGVVDVEQVGGRVFLSVCIAPSGSTQAVEFVYGELNKSFSAGGTDGALEPADLSALGFPEAPSGFERFYSPVTGQFFIYPWDWNVVNNVHDDSVILFNEKGALMISENRTDKFFERYNSNGNDVEDCFDDFLDECAGALETIYQETPRYHDFQYGSTKNEELIKATFNYTVKQGTGRCFAEFGVREFEGQEYVQATLCLYKVGDSYSIDMFSIIMDSTVIYYPNL